MECLRSLLRSSAAVTLCNGELPQLGGLDPGGFPSSVSLSVAPNEVFQKRMSHLQRCSPAPCKDERAAGPFLFLAISHRMLVPMRYSQYSQNQALVAHAGTWQPPRRSYRL